MSHPGRPQACPQPRKKQPKRTAQNTGGQRVPRHAHHCESPVQLVHVVEVFSGYLAFRSVKVLQNTLIQRCQSILEPI